MRFILEWWAPIFVQADRWAEKQSNKFHSQRWQQSSTHRNQYFFPIIGKEEKRKHLVSLLNKLSISFTYCPPSSKGAIFEKLTLYIETCNRVCLHSKDLHSIRSLLSYDRLKDIASFFINASKYNIYLLLEEDLDWIQFNQFDYYSPSNVRIWTHFGHQHNDAKDQLHSAQNASNMQIQGILQFVVSHQVSIVLHSEAEFMVSRHFTI